MTISSWHVTLLCRPGHTRSSELAGTRFRHIDSSIAGLLLFVAVRRSGIGAPVREEIHGAAERVR